MYHENDKDREYANAEHRDMSHGGYHDSRYTGRLEDESETGNRESVLNGADESGAEETTGNWAGNSSGYSGSAGGPDRSYIPSEPERREKKHRSLAGRAAAIAAAGVLFGCVAGGTMAGVNILTNRFAGSTVQPEALADDSQQLETEIQTQGVNTAVPVSTGNDVSAIVEKAMPSVVAINNKVVYTQNDWFFGTQKYEVPGSGSGIIASENENELLIVTNNHVVQDSEELSVTFIDGTSVKAAVKGTDAETDLAVIAVQLSDIPQETKDQIRTAQLGDSDSLKLGQGVVAIGNALGQGQSVTVGYVSALDKKVTIDNYERTLLQVDAAINPGNSGGALLNMEGEVIGINAAKYADTDVEGIGYAIPITQAKDIIDDLMTKTTKVEVAEDEQGYLGIQLQNIDSRMAKSYDMPEGIYVYKIVEGGAASKSDLRERDIITKFDGETVRTGDDLQKMLTYYKGGTTVTLTVQSLENGSYVEREISITLGYRSESEEQ